MAANSRIRLRKDGQQIRFQLNGDFDGSMAMQLIGLINDNCCDAESIVIDTTDLKQLYPFGVDVFRSRLRTEIKFPSHCRFVGSKSAQLRPN